MLIKAGLTLFVMTMLGASPAMALGQCQPLTRVANVELKALPNGRMLVPVTVDGHPEYFLLSTAVPLSSISCLACQAWRSLWFSIAILTPASTA